MTAAYALTARNTALQSSNRIHSDEVARQYGFGGGLVPGITSYAYLTHPVVERWGRDWLAGGTLNARFQKPVYDGESVEVSLSEAGEVTLTSRGVVCASGQAAPGPTEAVVPQLPHGELPKQRPEAARAAFEQQPVLGSITRELTEELVSGYLATIGESLPVYSEADLVHPGLLLGEANEVLMANVVLPPWVHIESEVRNLAEVRIGDTIETRARVSRLYERNGHEIVELEVLILSAGSGPVTSIRHTAIYRLRPPQSL